MYHVMGLHIAFHNENLTILEQQKVTVPNLQKNPACPQISIESPIKNRIKTYDNYLAVEDYKTQFINYSECDA